MSIIDEILEKYEELGQKRYGNSEVSQKEHAIQCAWLAERRGADAATIVAALLHDYGHLITEHGPQAALKGIDDLHEIIAYKALRRHFGDQVCLPIKLHVDAKRYLCGVEADYFDKLSPGSVRSLRLQGGPLTPAEAAAFIKQPYAAQAVDLRRWDEQAKVPDLTTPNLDHFRPYLERCLAADTPVPTAHVGG